MHPSEPSLPAEPVYDVLVVGDYCLDLIFTGLPGLPELGTELVGAGFAIALGGAANSAIAMHRLGLKVAWPFDYGADDFSQFALREAVAAGLDTSMCVHHDRPLRNVTVALSYPDDRSFVAFYDPPAEPNAGRQALARTATRAIYLAHVHHGPSFAPALARARAGGLRLVMDGNSADHSLRLSQPLVREAVAGVDLFLPNAVEARRLTGCLDLAEALSTLAQVCPLVVVKDGPNGAFACHEGLVLHQPAIPLQPVDTTGAGDCFSAGFLTAWLADRPLAECLRWGNIAGGLSTLALGGLGSAVTAGHVREWLQKDLGADMPPVYTRAFRIRHYECDAYGHVNNANYLRYMQEAAIDASAAVGYDTERYIALGHHWLVRETEIEYLRPLHYGDTVEVKTWVADFRRVRSRRDYELRSAATGELAARASTDWVFVNSATGEPALVPPEMVAAFLSELAPAQAARPRRREQYAPAPPGVFRMRRRVTFYDIDPARHVNNAVYLTYIGDCGIQVLAAYGWPLARMWERGFAILPRRHHLIYRVPAQLDDEIEITTWISDLRRATAIRHYLLDRVSDGAPQRLAEVHSLYVWVDLQSLQPIRVPSDFRADFESNLAR